MSTKTTKFYYPKTSSGWPLFLLAVAMILFNISIRYVNQERSLKNELDSFVHLFDKFQRKRGYDADEDVGIEVLRDGGLGNAVRDDSVTDITSDSYNSQYPTPREINSAIVRNRYLLKQYLKKQEAKELKRRKKVGAGLQTSLDNEPTPKSKNSHKNPPKFKDAPTKIQQKYSNSRESSHPGSLTTSSNNPGDSTTFSTSTKHVLQAIREKLNEIPSSIKEIKNTAQLPVIMDNLKKINQYFTTHHLNLGGKNGKRGNSRDQPDEEEVIELLKVL